jgi:hypothetical protein
MEVDVCASITTHRDTRLIYSMVYIHNIILMVMPSE